MLKPAAEMDYGGYLPETRLAWRLPGHIAAHPHKSSYVMLDAMRMGKKL
jgi:hypothetical protein